jgi:hypothetical protein
MPFIAARSAWRCEMYINHTTIGLSKETKARIDKCKAQGQCYGGFVSELMDLWEKVHSPETDIRLYKKEFMNINSKSPED